MRITHFATDFCMQYMTSVCHLKLTFFTHKAWLHLSLSVLKTTGVGAILI
jgi:hypothetical protein